MANPFFNVPDLGAKVRFLFTQSSDIPHPKINPMLSKGRLKVFHSTFLAAGYALPKIKD
ncbi:MAG: hypothetical protein ACE5H4_02630 [Candidatus Thorarchaeota archaeon]